MTGAREIGKSAEPASASLIGTKQSGVLLILGNMAVPIINHSDSALSAGES